MVNNNIFLGSGASTTFVPETDLFMVLSAINTSTGVLSFANWGYPLVPNLYIGCEIEIWANGGSARLETFTIKSNTTNTITVNGTITRTFASNDFCVLQGYGAPTPHPDVSNKEALCSDNWMGITETMTFPTITQDLKQTNLGLGGTRNWTYQYKGIRTSDGGSFSLVANTGAWLYYALGKMTDITYTADGGAFSLIGGSSGAAFTATADKAYIQFTGSTVTDEGCGETGPFFYRTVKGGTGLMPPFQDQLYDKTKMVKLNETALITYTITEQDTSELPSFSLEQSISKDPLVLTTDATQSSKVITAHESTSFTRIARGNRINDLTLEAAEGEELKMTCNLNTRVVDSITDLYRSANATPNYTARAGQGINSNLNNWQAGTDAGIPFFFSQGSFEALGVQFLKISSVTIVITNNLQDKRYMGGHRDMKDGLAGQRDYEITFTAIVTDDKLFNEMLNETENTGSDYVKFQFDKPDSGEQIKLHFKDYFFSQTTVTIPDDKGPVTFEGTIKPRTLEDCTVITNWKLMA
tara:strand:- start:2192 stop:3769 length:1578 start_codon:yes stop_codon:yes gene_type:complete